VGHSLLADLTGRPCDYTAPAFALLHRLTFIPIYDRAAAADKATSRPSAPALPAAPAAAKVVNSAATNGAKKGAGKGKNKEL
jgi:hypothetical protein